MDLTMKYQDRSGAWKDFDMADLMDEPARHSVLMFSRTNIPVIVRQGAAYIVNTEDLKPYEKTARTHPEEQIRKLVDSIRDFGFNVPILIGEDNKIIAGHGRLVAAKRLNMKSVPCIKLDHLSDEDRRRFIAVDNLTHGMGGYDMDLLKLEILS